MIEFTRSRAIQGGYQYATRAPINGEPGQFTAVVDKHPHQGAKPWLAEVRTYGRLLTSQWFRTLDEAQLDVRRSYDVVEGVNR
jgi:hypothetical protein